MNQEGRENCSNLAVIIKALLLRKGAGQDEE